MDMQVDTLWLFEAKVADPFFLGNRKGIITRMVSERVIGDLRIYGPMIKIGTFAQAALEYGLAYGGEDTGATEGYGKTTAAYSLHFNVPLGSPGIIEKLSGRAFSVVGLRAASYFAIFAPFIAKKTTVGNDIVQRVVLEAPPSPSRMYKVDTFRPDEDAIFYVSVPAGECPPASAPPPAVAPGFDYAFGFMLN